MYSSVGGQHQVLNPKKVATVMLLTLILAMVLVYLNPTLAQSNQEQKQKAETLINILDPVNASITEAKDRLASQKIPVPQAAETEYNEGVAHAEEAANLLNIEHYAAASAEAVEAMQKFKDTLLILQEASPTEPTETEATAEGVINLKANITRAYEYIERVENLTVKARTAGYNTTDIDDKILLVKEHLENATDELDALNLNGATQQLQDAKNVLEELKEFYIRLVNRVKLVNTRRYLEEIAKRVNETKTNIANTATLPTQNRTDALSALDNSESSLEKAGNSIEKGNVDDAIDELEEAKMWEDESRKYLSPSVSATPSQTSAVDKNMQRTGAATTK
jgi:archaellum component FlaC